MAGPDTRPREFKVVRVNPDRYGGDVHMEEDGRPADRTAWYAPSPETDALREDVRFWLGNMRWYHERGFPWRLGVMLHGPPGSGKTALVRLLAQEFQVPLFLLAGSSLRTMQDWTAFWSDAAVHARPPVFVLIEEFDLHLRPTRVAGLPETDDSEPQTKPSNDGVQLSSLLNLMDGVSTPDGVMFFVTTNHPDSVEEAAVRRGRIDVRVRVGEMTEDQRRHVAQRALVGFSGEDVERVVREGAGEVAVDFRERCRQLALGRELRRLLP